MTKYKNIQYSYSKKKESPCMNCVNRKIECHSNCDKYKEYQKV